jgi:DNA-binding NarL/FixJ family response regulator
MRGIRVSEDGRRSHGKLVMVAVGRFEPVVALGLNVILQGDHRIRVLETDVEREALESLVVRHRPGVVIVDAPPERAIRDRLQWLTRSGSAVLVFASDPTPTYGMRVLALGAACVARSVSPAEILDAVHLLAQGGRAFALSNVPRVERRYPANAPALTKRQREVLRCLSEGKPHKQIAHELEIGERTVHSHAMQVCRKLNVRGKRELIGMLLPSDES